MRKHIVLLVLILLSVILSASVNNVQKDVWGKDTPHTPSIPQERETWCFYAVIEVFTSSRQTYSANRYQQFLKKNEGIPPIDCYVSPHLCGGVKYKHIVDYWNEMTSDRKASLGDFSDTYYLGSKEQDVALPRPGIILRSDNSAHSVVIYYVEIHHNELETCIVKYNDP